MTKQLPSKRVIATFSGTAGELLARCKEVLGEQSVAVTCECNEHDYTEEIADQEQRWGEPLTESYD